MASNALDDRGHDYGIARLTALMAPPLAGDEVDWAALRERGLFFPTDYQAFVARYGGGELDEVLSIATPPVPGSNAYMDHLEPWTLEMSERTGLPGEETRALPFGYGLDGEVVFWECASEDPDDWTLIVFRRQHGPYEPRWVRYGMGMVEFLIRLIERTVDNPLAAAGVPRNPPVYRNWRSES